MYLLIIFLPLLSSVALGLFGRFLGKKGSTYIALLSMATALCLSLFIYYEVVLCQAICSIKLFKWINCGLLQVTWGFLFDSLTANMLLIVLGISCLVHIYSVSYMGEDPHYIRFMSYLSLFTLFMVILVTADNFLQLFLGWEGVGLASYLLINFWYTRVQANKSAMKAIIVNRIGDFGLSLGIFGIFYLCESLDYNTVFAVIYKFKQDQLPIFNINAITLISILLFIGAVGKSAQVGLHTWLPDAMEGPTPVSALIHAATMVTAGVFMLIRVSPILEYSTTVLLIITIFGGLTAIFAAISGAFQNDLKKVIAYSTCSQLGYMAFACGLSNYSIGFFHLLNHAYFKALLFLCAGSIIHALYDEQDLRKMGNLALRMPVTYIMMLIGSLALMGFPFLTGYYSKDLILETTYVRYTISSLFVYWLGLLGAVLTAYYSFRSLFLVFWIKTNMSRKLFLLINESDFWILIPLLLLSLCSIFIGYLTHDLLIGLGTDVWGNSIFCLIENVRSIESELLPLYIKHLPLFFSLFGVSSSFILYNTWNNVIIRSLLLFQWLILMYQDNTKNKLNFFICFFYKYIYIFYNKTWYIDYLYNKYIVLNLMKFSYKITFRGIDRGLIEKFGPLGIIHLCTKIVKKFQKIQNGYIYTYIYWMLLSVFCCLFCMFLLHWNCLILFKYLFIFNCCLIICCIWL